MESKSISLSSSGLKNISINKLEEEDFIMVFNDKQIKMNNLFAQFISPIVSNYCHSDPTINMINFDDFITGNKSDYVHFIEEAFTTDTISLLHQISTGNSIEINENQAFKMRFVSIILGNEELFSKINENYPPDFNEANINVYLEYIQSYYFFSRFPSDFDFSSILDNISKNFYLIDLDKFLKLSRKMQYAIISSPNLQIKNEDSLLDIIHQIIDRNDKDDEIDDVLFLEHIEYTGLSEKKLREFLSYFDFNQITSALWSKLFQCFFKHFENSPNRYENQHLIKSESETYEYIENETNRFGGIIHHLTTKYGGNVHEKKIVNVTSSSIYQQYLPMNAVDFSNSLHFWSLSHSNAWLKYDFKDKKVHPTFYSIRTYSARRGSSHLKSWVIEGSNTENDNDWKILDSRNNMTCLNNTDAEVTLKITENLDENESFRFLRIRQTGTNYKNGFSLAVSALEFFGSLI